MSLGTEEEEGVRCGLQRGGAGRLCLGLESEKM